MPLNFRRLSASREVLAQAVADEAVLLDLKSEKYFGLDPVGTRVWSMLQETDDVDLIKRKLLDEYQVAEAVLEQDLNELFARLLKAGLVHENRPA